MNESIDEAALQYASFGWPVVPVIGKVPSVGNDWQTKASRDPEAVAKLFSENHHDGIGVIIGERSGLIDFDPDTPEAEQTLCRLFDGHEVPSPSFQSEHGRHVLFKWTDKLPQGKIKIVVDGLEIRLGNGSKACQSVFPPSGGREWLILPEDCPVAEIPEVVIDRINAIFAKQEKPKAVTRQSEFSTSSNVGDDALNVPRWLAKHGHQIIGRTDGSDGVTRWHIECPGIERHTTANSYRDCCVTQDSSGRLGGCCFHSSCGVRDWESLKAAIGPPDWSDYHPDADVSFSVISEPITADIEAPVTPVDVELVAVISKPVITIDDLNPGGTLQEWIDYTLRTAFKRQPELALLAAIAGFATVIGRKVQDDYGTRPNVYCVGIAPSSCGKQHPISVNKLIIAQAGGELMLQDSLASHAGLHSAIDLSPSMLLQSDEMGRLFASLSNLAKAPPHLAGIIDIWLKLFSSSGTVYIAPAYADRKNNYRVTNPNLCIYGTSVPGNFFSSLTTDSLSDGLFNRFLIAEISDHDPDPQKPDSAVIPEGLIETVKWWINYHPGQTDFAPTARVLVSSPGAIAEFDVMQNVARQRQRDEQEMGTQIWGRAFEYGRKLALIHQCSLGKDSEMISVESAKWGCGLAYRLIDRMEQLADQYISDGSFDARGLKVLKFITDAGAKGRSRGEISRRIRSVTPRDLTDTLVKLIEMEKIESIDYQAAKGPMGKKYVSIA